MRLFLMKLRKNIKMGSSAPAVRRLSALLLTVFFVLLTACGEPEPPAEREPAAPVSRIRSAGADYKHRDTLDKLQAEMYETIGRSLKSPSDEVLIYECKGDYMDFLVKDALKAMTCYMMDHPLESEILANCDIRIEKIPKSGGRYRVFAYRREEADTLELAVMKRRDVKTVSENFTASIADLSDEEKLRAIHDRLCRGTYDMDVSAGSHTVYSALINKFAVCDGYAYAFKYLCDLSGIKCAVVIGTFDKSLGDEPGHAWNIVWFEDSWKLVDIACDVYDASDGYSSPSYRHFLSDDLHMYGRAPYKAYPVPVYKEYK